jgi:hypothetical protein
MLEAVLQPSFSVNLVFYMRFLYGIYNKIRQLISIILSTFLNNKIIRALTSIQKSFRTKADIADHLPDVLTVFP